MAKLNEDNSVEFSDVDVLAAWENSPSLINKAEEDFRMCYLCKFHMIKKELNNKKIGAFGWVIDLINIKKPELIPTNFIAVHPGCIEFKNKLDNTKTLKKIKQLSWAFDESTYDK